MRKLTSVAKAADDLRSHVHFDAETGQIWLNENRMLLVHAEAQALLRKELIDTLGMERARGLLTRMGYASGVRDAELARKQAQGVDDMEAFMTGPKLHTLEGIVRVTPIRLEMDRPRGQFYGEFLWENSWEGQWHRQYFGIHHEPVCWTQIGYASGYTSAFMGRRILYQEVECVGAGDNNCRIVGKPIEEWEDADEQMRYYNPESIADQLIDLQTQVTHLRSSIGEKESLPEHMIGVSPGFRAAYGLLKQAADSQIPVLLLGETGVGKEVFARCLHEMGPRAGEAFVAVNCAAIPQELVESELFGVEKGAYTGAQSSRPGRFERASGGTLFLDEVGDLPLSAQAKLLRVLQEREIERLGDAKPRKVDVRVVAATNADLSKLVKEGRFRLDLYYRLNIITIDIPPLRDRKEDIVELVSHFVNHYRLAFDKEIDFVPKSVINRLLLHDWPGNVRELENLIQRAVLMSKGKMITEGDLLFDQDPRMERRTMGGFDLNGRLGSLSLKEILTEVESAVINEVLHRCEGNVGLAATQLQIGKTALYDKMKQRGITPKVLRKPD